MYHNPACRKVTTLRQAASTPIAVEPVVEITTQTPTGQSRLAYRLAAALLLLNAILGLVGSMASGAVAAPSMIVIDSALALGLIDLRRGAHALALFRASVGAIVGTMLAASFLLRAAQPLAAAISGALAQLAYAGSIILLLSGKSKPWRIALAMGVFLVGLASARLGEPLVVAGAGQTPGGAKVATDVLLALAITELVVATVIKQLAPPGWLSRLAMYTLAVISITTMVWVAWLVGISQYVEVLVVTVLWPAAAVIVLAPHGQHERPQTLPQRPSSDTWKTSRTRWVPSAISFILALFLNALVILLVNRGIHGRVFGSQSGQAYLLLCLPLSAVILALGALAGAKFAEGYGSSPWKGAALGIWIGALASMALSLWGILNGEPRIDW